jgi:hypothetical protein
MPVLATVLQQLDPKGYTRGNVQRCESLWRTEQIRDPVDRATPCIKYAGLSSNPPFRHKAGMQGVAGIDKSTLTVQDRSSDCSKHRD